MFPLVIALCDWLKLVSDTLGETLQPYFETKYYRIWRFENE